MKYQIMQQKNYSPIVLEHYRHPRNFGRLEKPTHTGSELNPLCGDEITVYLSVQGGTTSGGKISDIKYEGRGCALMIASASILSENIKGLEIKEIKKINKTEIEKLLNIKVSQARESCVTLALNTIKKVINLSP